jgi:hypothetical protein
MPESWKKKPVHAVMQERLPGTKNHPHDLQKSLIKNSFSARIEGFGGPENQRSLLAAADESAIAKPNRR